MSVLQTLTAVHVIETAHNYARADDPLQQPTPPPAGSGKPAKSAGTREYWDGESFWEEMFISSSGAWNTVFRFNGMRLSEWVARIPGLLWKPESSRLLDSVKNAKKLIGGYAYDPHTRSIRVMGGVGTLRLPPGDDGSWLATLVRNGDVAGGVPVLMTADVRDHIQEDNSCEGRVISGTARWVPMSQHWATNFPVIRDIPRGYLLLNNPDAIAVGDGRAQTYIAPFSIMEYEAGASELFDYVYVGVRTDEKDYRDQVADYYNRYHKDVSSRAHYLIASDMVEPMWDAEFLSPAELRRLDASAKSQLSLLEARVREHMLGKQVIEPLLQALGETIHDPDELIVLAGEIELKPAVWLAGGNLAEQISQLVDAAAQHEKLDDLIVRLAARHPGLFQEPGKE